MAGENSFRGSVVLGVSILLASFVFGMFFYLSRGEERTVRVVGAATIRTGSDVAKLRISLSRVVGPQDIREGYRGIGRDVSVLSRELAGAGFAKEEIQVNPANSYQNYSQQGGITGYTVQQSVVVTSKNVDTLQALALRPDRVLDLGVMLQSLQIEYFSSNLLQYRKSLLALAHSDARRRPD